MSHLDKLFLLELREQFFQKIADDWDAKWAVFGEVTDDDFSEINLTAFVEALLADITLVLADIPKKDLIGELTLRRILMKAKIDTRMQSHTRNCLARYLGFANWEDFKTKNFEKIQASQKIIIEPSFLPILQRIYYPERTPERIIFYPLPTQTHLKKYMGFALGIVIAIILALGEYKLYRKHQYDKPFTKAQLSGVQFEIVKSVGKFAPQTLLFKYDIQSLGVDSAKIDLDDNTEDYIGEKNDLNFRKVKGYAGTIEVPIYKSDLRLFSLWVNGKSVKNIPWTIPSNGWNGWITGLDSYISPAVDESVILKDGNLHYPPELIFDSKIRQYFASAFSLTKDFGLDGDSATIEIKFKNPFKEGGISCYSGGIGFYTDEGKKNIQKQPQFGYWIGRFGCPGHQSILGQIYTWQNSMAEGLQADMEQWQVIKISNKNGRTTFYKNGISYFETPYQINVGKVKKIEIGFKGAGSVDFVKLVNSYTGKVVFYDDFVR